METKVEVTENYIRIPNPKHSCNSKNIRTIDISKTKGIKALYCIDHKKIKTYLFDKKKWTLDEAKKWVEENAKEFGKFMNKEFAKAYVEKIAEKGDEGELGLAVISSGTVDRDGDVLNPDGWDFSNFVKNPVLLWSHNAGVGEKRPPIGKVKNIEVKDGKVYFTPVFDLKDNFAAEIFRKFKEGFLNAFSIGFLPLEWTETDTGYNFAKLEALEFSAVNVPANPEALVVLREAGFEVSKSFEDWKHPIKEEVNTEKSVVPYKKYPLAPEDMAWDGPAQIRECGDDLAKLKRICTWYDSEHADVKSSYKLPHHLASDNRTVWNGVRAAMAALMGARGGVDMPEAEKKGAYNHLAKHYKDFDREPPEFKHFDVAIWKVTAGKKIEDKPGNVKEVPRKDKDVLIGLLRGLANVLERQPITNNNAPNGKGNERKGVKKG